MSIQKYISVISITDHPNPTRVDRLYYDCVEDLVNAYDTLCVADVTNDSALRAHLVTLCLRLKEVDRYSKPRSQEWLDAHPGAWAAMCHTMQTTRSIVNRIGDLDYIRSLLAADRKLPVAA